MIGHHKLVIWQCLFFHPWRCLFLVVIHCSLAKGAVARVGTGGVPGCNLPGMDRHAVGKGIGN